MHIEVAKGAPVEEAENIADGVMYHIHSQNKNNFCAVQIETQKMPKSISGGRK
jgi:hypothetical protein